MTAVVVPRGVRILELEPDAEKRVERVALDFGILEWHHVGICVDTDLDVAMERYGTLLGVKWAIPIDIDQVVLTPDGSVRRAGRAVTSLDNGGQHFELFRATAGPSVKTHLGAFAEDIDLVADQLRDEGWVSKWHYSGVHYIQDTVGGVTIELLASSIRPAMDRWTAGQSFVLPGIARP